VRYLNNIGAPDGSSGHQTAFSSNDYGFSWWGLTGAEDLGSGLKAVFKLESAFSSGTGAQADPNGYFARHSYVGLEHPTYGSLWLGRSMSLADETGWYIDPMAEQLTGVGTFAKGRAWGPRINAITYNSPRWQGFSFRLQGALGEQRNNSRGNRLLSASAAYELGGFNAYGVYEDLRDQAGDLSSLYFFSRVYMIGATYKLGAAKLFAGGQRLSTDESRTVAEASNPTAANRNDQGWIGASYSFTPEFTLSAGLYHAKVNRNGGSANLGALGATYYLSRRTFLYATFADVNNRGNAAFPVIVYAPGPLPDHNQQGTFVGMMHYF
jgi:predicted porin